jgi:hypothetical protein
MAMPDTQGPPSTEERAPAEEPTPGDMRTSRRGFLGLAGGAGLGVLLGPP